MLYVSVFLLYYRKNEMADSAVADAFACAWLVILLLFALMPELEQAVEDC